MDRFADNLLTYEDGQPHLPIRTRSSPRKNVWRDLGSWLFEISSLTLGIISILIIFALLKAYDQKPLPRWHLVTYNAVISILAQAVKAALAGPLAETLGQLKWHEFWNHGNARNINDFAVYDAASRGPSGAFLMLCKRRLWGISSFAAILTVVALATEPFLQQIPAYPVRLRAAKDSALISRATSYIGETMNVQGGDLSSTYTNALNSPIKGAFYNGMYGSSRGSPISPTCRSGNCTWDVYTSLGVCSACENIASTLTHRMEPGFDDMQYMWKAPNGMYAGSSWTSMQTETDLPSIKFQHLQNYSIADITSIYFGRTGDLDFSRPAAFECILYFCVQTFSTDVSNGTLTEKVISTFPDISTPADVANSAIHVPINKLPPSDKKASNGTFYYKSPKLTNLHPNGAAYPYEDATGLDRLNVTISPPRDPQNYNISGPTVVLAREWFQQKLKTYVGKSNAPETKTGDMAQLFYDTAGDPTHLLQRTASVLTAEIRKQSGEYARGTTLVEEPYVQVRWGWIALPIIMLASIVLLMFVVGFLSRSKEIPTWKTNPLPGLVFALDEGSSTMIAANGPDIRGLEEEAERYSMFMSTEEKIWRLEGVRSADEVRKDDSSGQPKSFKWWSRARRRFDRN